MSVRNRNAFLSVSVSHFKGDGGTESDTFARSEYSGNEGDENGNVVTRKVEPSPRFITVCDSFCHGAMMIFEETGSA